MSGVKLMAYTNVLAILLSEMFMSEIMGDVGKGVPAARCGLGINAAKMELILFTTVTKISHFQLPGINAERLALSSNVKLN